MTISIKWENPGEADEIIIYKSETPFEEDNLPEPYAVIEGNKSQFNDNDVKLNKVYYYRIAKVLNGHHYISHLMNDCHMLDKGPGGTSVLFGTWDKGFMGTLTEGEFVSNIHLAEFVSEHTGVNIRPNPDPVEWIKLVVNKRILYVPKDRMNHNSDRMSWKQAYEGGLAYGIDGTGYTPPNVTPTNQLSILTHKNRHYIVRLMEFYGTKDNAGRYDRMSFNSTDLTISNFGSQDTEYDLLRKMNYTQMDKNKLPMFTFQRYMGATITHDGLIMDLLPQSDADSGLRVNPLTLIYQFQHFVLELLPKTFILNDHDFKRPELYI